MSPLSELADRADALHRHLDQLVLALEAGQYLAALRHANLLAEDYGDLVADIAQAAYDAGQTKKAIANALNVSASTFRGMQRRT